MAYYFVGGSQRSGTTLLATILCAGQETNEYLGESSTLRSLVESYNFMRGRFDTETKFHFGTQTVMDEYFANVVRSFLSHTLATLSPATSLVLKEPHLTCYFPHLFRLIPSARFVMIKRDPRDIVVSMLKVGERLAANGQKHMFNSGDIGRIASSITPFYAPTINLAKRNKNFRNACMWVEYEQLTREPEAAAESLRRFTGLKLEEFDKENPSRHVNEEKRKIRVEDKRIKPWVSELTDKGSISDQNVGQYANVLTEEQIATVENTLGDLMKALGYKPVTK
ncbi:MAG: sulfotransferase [Alphaproteobacteria bacterium]|nr:sulfotransferase [Alphaproteobacteria bacterium]